MSNSIFLPWQHPSVRTVSSRVAATVAQRIIEGVYPPGELLTEVAVAASLNVSRTPVREALLQLQTWNLVRLYPKKGAVVTALGAKERRDLLDFRATWETKAVSALPAHPNRQAQLITDLSGILEKQARCVDDGDGLGFAATDYAFHLRIIESYGNSVVSASLDTLGPQLARLTYQVIEASQSLPQDLLAEHSALVTHIIHGQADKFATAIFTHIETAHFPQASQ